MRKVYTLAPKDIRAHEILVCIALYSTEGTGEPTQTPQGIHCFHTKDIDVHELFNQILEIYTRWPWVSSRISLQEIDKNMVWTNGLF